MGRIDRKKFWVGLLMVPPILILLSLGPPTILILMVLGATLLGLREFYRLAQPRAKPVERDLSIGLGLLLSILMACGDFETISAYLVFLILALSVLFMVTSEDLLPAISSMGVSLLGILFIAFLLAHISLIRQMENGREWVIFLVATVWAGDIFAYLCGSFFGKHKLYPKISPNKTYEGLGGALLGSVLIALTFTRLFIPQVSAGRCVLLGLGLGLVGQFGDFTESMLKRSAQVKDSGTIIPGHGGMLDRLDSFLFSSPLLYYSLLYGMKDSS